MNRSELQKIIDELIGEATLALLMKAGPVTTKALLKQLRFMEEQADGSAQRQYVALAIKEVTRCMTETQVAKRSDNNVVNLFADEYGTGNQRKH